MIFFSTMLYVVVYYSFVFHYAGMIAFYMLLLLVITINLFPNMDVPSSFTVLFVCSCNTIHLFAIIQASS